MEFFRPIDTRSPSYKGSENHHQSTSHTHTYTNDTHVYVLLLINSNSKRLGFQSRTKRKEWQQSLHLFAHVKAVAVKLYHIATVGTTICEHKE